MRRIGIPKEPGRPAELPIDNRAHPRPEPVKVWTENGTDVFFDVTARRFEALLDGSTSPIRSADFDEVLKRIRARSLVEPVVGYVITCHDGFYRRRDDVTPESPIVTVDRVTVVEHHKGRQDPFVVESTERQAARISYGRTPSVPPETVVRVTLQRDIHLPTAEQVATLVDACTRLQEEHWRHAEALKQLGAEKQAALGAIRQLGPADITYVQKKREQVAEPGLATFDLTDEDAATD
jgi:hypothetical protein